MVLHTSSECRKAELVHALFQEFHDEKQFRLDVPKGTCVGALA